MMHLQAGVLLESTELLNDTIFEGSIIFITEHNAAGAVGFVVNRPFGRSLNELEEFRQIRSFPLYDGGPVDKEHLFFLHRRPDVIDEGIPVNEGIYFGGNFKQAVDAVNRNIISSNEIKIFVGYCGWDTGELKAEIEEGSWLLTDGSVFDVFRWVQVKK